MSQIPKYYRKALKQKIIDDFGTQAEFCRRHKLDPPKVSEMLSGSRNFTFDTMDKFAAAVGSTALELIIVGKALSEKNKSDEDNIIDLFMRKPIASEINKKLSEIEHIESDRVEEFNEVLGTLLNRLRRKHSITKEFNGKDRRSGIERRQSNSL